MKTSTFHISAWGEHGAILEPFADAHGQVTIDDSDRYHGMGMGDLEALTANAGEPIEVRAAAASELASRAADRWRTG